MSPDFDKMPDGLVPAIIQDADNRAVLMLGYMNREAFRMTRDSGNVWFFSRSKGRLWMKGERSGNILQLVGMRLDCDSDAILVTARPTGPVCHTGDETCFGPAPERPVLRTLEEVIASRKSSAPTESYVASLFAKGINKIAQKVGEEAVELVIEAKDDNEALFLNEAADLLFHYLILLQAKGHRLSDVEAVLQSRER